MTEANRVTNTIGYLWEGPIGMTLLAVVFGVVAAFFAAFAFKVAYLEHRRRRAQPGGFEVKLTTDRPDGPPVTEEKANDHG